MSSTHATGSVTVTLNREDFERIVADALESVVREPYGYKLVVDAIGQNITDNASDGWYVDYHIEKDATKK